MSANMTLDDATLQAMAARIKAASSELGEACEYVGAAMRGQLLRLHAALSAGRDVEAASIFESMRDSDLVQGLAAKFHDLRENVTRLRDELAPWGKVIVGLVAMLAGFFIFAEISMVVAAILVIGGLAYALLNALDVLSRKGGL